MTNLLRDIHQSFPVKATLCLLTFLATTVVSPAKEPVRDFTALQSFLDYAVTEGQVAGGCLLVIHKGEIAFHEGFGFADIEKKTPFRKDTPVVVASISKPLLGTAIHHFAGTGKVDLTAPISKYLPEFEGIRLESGQTAGRAPTLREILTHTSGTRADEAKLGRPWYAEWTYGTPLSEVVARYARDFPLRSEPGTRYAYSGIGTDIAARVAEVAAGKPRNQFIVDELATPLGMKTTFYRSADRLPAAMPTRYYLNDEGNLAVSRPRPLPEPDTYSSSGGSIISTAPDLARWLLMIRNGGTHDGKPYLSSDTIHDMLTPAPVGKNTSCGFFARQLSDDGRPSVIGHTGSSGTDCWVDFKNDVIGIMLTQTKGSDIKEFRLEVEKRVAAEFASK